MKKSFIILSAIAAAIALTVVPALAEAGWVSETFGSLLEVKWQTALIVAAFFSMGAVICTQKRGSWTTRRMAYASMCIAIAFVLSCIKLFRMPQGGSVTPAAMLPLILFALACGPVQGMVVGFAFGLLQGGITEDGLVAALVEKYGGNEEDVRMDVAHFLSKLKEADALV